MADREVRVRLSAQVSQFMAGMAQAGAASSAAAAKMWREWQAAGASMQRIGRTMSMGVTLPLVGLGVTAVRAGQQFNGAFTRMQALAGVTAGELGGLRDRVLDLSRQTGRGPTELANALYTLRSSGLDAGQAMEALDMSAKASAVGLGNTAVIADAVSSAMNAYATSGLTAADATDVLVATARAGKAEPDQLAASLGRILPISSELGVSFQEVGGAIAALSLSGNDAAQSSTLLTNVLAKMLKPSQQAAEQLAGIGMSVESLQTYLDERGLLATLTMLKDRLGDNGFARFLEDQQAVQGALALTGQNAERVREVFGEVENSAGSFAQAWATWLGDPSTQMSRDLGALQVALVELGQQLVPIATDFAQFGATVANAFTDLPEPVQELAIGLGVLAAVSGPLLMVAGAAARVASGVGLMVDAFRGMPPGLLSFLGGAATGVGLGFALGPSITGQTQGDFNQSVWRGAQRVGGWLNPVPDTVAVAGDVRDALTPNVRGRMSTPGGRITPTLPPGYIGPPAPGQTVSGPVFGPPSPSDWLGAPGRSYQAQFAAQLEAQREAENAARIARNRQQIGGATPYARDLTFTSDINEIVRAGFEAAEAINQAKAAAEEYTRVASSSDWGAARFNAANTAMREYTSEAFGLVNIQMAQEEAYDRLNEAIEDNGFTLDVTTEKGRENMVALQGVASVLDTQFVSAYDNANGSLDTFMTTATKIGEQTLTRLQTELGLTDEQTDELREVLNLTATDYTARFKMAGHEEARIRLGLLSGVIGLLQEDVQREVAMKIATGDFQGALETVQANIAETPKKVPVTITAIDNATGTIGRIAGSLFNLKDKTVTVTAKQVGSVGIKKKAMGGYVDSAEFAMIGEAGPEVVLPLSRPDRMRQLLTDPRVMSPLSAAMAGNGGSVMTSMTAPSTSVVVNNYRRDLGVADLEIAVKQARFAA